MVIQAYFSYACFCASFSLNRYPKMALLDHTAALFFSLWHLPTALHGALLIHALIINEGEYFCLYVHASIYYLLFCFPSGHYFEQDKISQLLLMLLHIPAHPLYSAAADLSFVGVQRHVLDHFLWLTSMSTNPHTLGLALI